MLETRKVRVLSLVRWQAVPHTRACSTETSVTNVAAIVVTTRKEVRRVHTEV